MSYFTSARRSTLLGACALLGALFVAGCASMPVESGAATEARGAIIEGHVHGGAYPIQGATISLMETQVGATLNGGNPSTYTSAAKVLETQLSDSNGHFTFDANWTCSSGQYAYMTVTGGQTISGKQNNNVIQVGAIGSCDTLNANVANVNVWLSELSTVAAAYTLRNFISISPNDGSGTQQVNISAPPANLSTGACSGTGTNMTCTGAGLAHAFANAINLVDSVRYDGSFPSGQANSTFVLTTNAQATIPQAMINSLGNILQTCVDSAGLTNSSSVSATSSDGTRCGTLFEYATPPVAKASSPLNTLQAILNIAQYPTNNVDALFNLQPQAVFFTPTLASDAFSNATSSCASNTSSCIAYTVGIFYTGNGVAKGGKLQSIGAPVDMALDAADNMYVAYTDAIGSNSTYGAISAFGANGLGLFADVRSTAAVNPAEIAIDNVNNAWITSDTSSGNLLAFSTANGAATQTIAITNGYPAGLAVGLANDVWVSRDSADSNQSLFHFVPPANGTTYTSSTFSTTPSIGASVKRLALTYPQNLYGVTASTNAASQAIRFPYGKYAASTTLATANLGASGGSGIAIGRYMAPNGGQEAFFPLNGEMDSTNAPNDTIQVNSNSAGSLTGISNSAVPSSAVVDGAGTLFWTDNEATGRMFRLVLPTGSGSSTSTSVNNGTLISYIPCYVSSATNYKCYLSTAGTNLRGEVIDSSGTIWSAANNGVFQLFGVASPSFPLLAYGHGAVAVQ